MSQASNTPSVPAFRVTFELLLAANDHEAAGGIAGRMCGQMLDDAGAVSVEAWVDEKPQEFFDLDEFPGLVA